VQRLANAGRAPGRRDQFKTRPRDSVTRIEFHELSSGRTMALFLTVFGVITALAVAAAISGPWLSVGPTI
jgi:hypothetical protein